MDSSFCMKTLNTTIILASCSSNHSRTVRTAIRAASSCGKPKTPVLIRRGRFTWAIPGMALVRSTSPQTPLT